VAFVTTRSKDGIINAAPFSYFNIVSSAPPMISIGVIRDTDEPKDTAKNIKEMKEFVVHIVDSDNVEEVNKTAMNLPYGESEMDLTKLTLVPSTKVKVPGIKESKVRFEVELEDIFEIKDGEKIVTDLVIGRIVGFHILEDILYDGKIDPLKLDPVARLAGSNYSKLGEIFSLVRPQK
jgi:flavin reductase (DIM6/NTAB) family NADH-FMN oxidoreductase RutF